MGLGHLDNVKNETQWFSLVMKMHCKSEQSLVVRRRPSVERKAQLAIEFLLTGEPPRNLIAPARSHPQHLRDACAALGKNPLDVARDRRRRWNLVFRSAGLHQLQERPVAYDLKWMLILCHPPNDPCPRSRVGRINTGLLNNGMLHSPRLHRSVLPYRVANLAFTHALERLRDGTRPPKGLDYRTRLRRRLLRLCRAQDLMTPASLDVITQVTRRGRVLRIQIPSDFLTAAGLCAGKDMANLFVRNLVDADLWVVECIDR